MSYQQLLARKAELERQRQEVEVALRREREAQLADVIQNVRKLMAEHGLTAADLGLRGEAARKAAGIKVKAKYRNQATGETWTGRGITPKWLQAAIDQGQSKESFLIER